MSLSRELGMSRRQLLNSLDSYELTMWSEYFKEANKPYQKKQSKEEIEEKIKQSLTYVKTKDKKKKKGIK